MKVKPSYVLGAIGLALGAGFLYINHKLKSLIDDIDWEDDTF